MFRLLDAFPLLLLVIIAYGLFVMITGAAGVPEALAAPLFSINIISSDTLTFLMGDLFILISIILLFVEILKSTSSGAIAIANHALSAGVMTIAIIFLLVLKGFGTSTFLFITLLTMFDVIAGFIITTITARRDIGVGGGVIGS